MSTVLVVSQEQYVFWQVFLVGYLVLEMWLARIRNLRRNRAFFFSSQLFFTSTCRGDTVVTSNF